MSAYDKNRELVINPYVSKETIFGRDTKKGEMTYIRLTILFDTAKEYELFLFQKLGRPVNICHILTGVEDKKLYIKVGYV